MRFHQILLLGLLGLAAIVLPACDQSDASSIKITLRHDLSGEILASAVGVRDAADGPVQKASTGANWKAAGTVIVARAEFLDISKVDVAGITFAASSKSGAPVLRVTIPRGAGAKWAEAFSVRDREARKNAARTLDPAAKATSVGENVKIQITVPGVVISAGADTRERGINSSYEETLATLIIPVDLAATAQARPIIWDITWKEHTVP